MSGCLSIFAVIFFGWALYSGWPLPGPRGRGTAEVHVHVGAMTIADGKEVRFGGPCTYEIRTRTQTSQRFLFHLDDSTSGLGMTIAFTNRPRTAHYVIDSFSGTGTTWVEYRGFARNNVERFAWGRGELTVDGDEIPIVIHAKGMLYERTGAAARFEASCRITQKVAR